MLKCTIVYAKVSNKLQYLIKREPIKTTIYSFIEHVCSFGAILERRKYLPYRSRDS